MGKAQIQPRATEQTAPVEGSGAKAPAAPAAKTPPTPPEPPPDVEETGGKFAAAAERYAGLAFCAEGTSFPWHAVFAQLRDEWKRRHPEKTWADLGDELGFRSQKVSQWATGSDPTQIPPSWVIMRLCQDLGVTIVWAPDKVDLIRTSNA